MARKEQSLSYVALPTHVPLFITKPLLTANRGTITKHNPGALILETRDTQMCGGAPRVWGLKHPLTLRADSFRTPKRVWTS